MSEQERPTEEQTVEKRAAAPVANPRRVTWGTRAR